MLKVTAVLLSALVLGACASDVTGPRPTPALVASSSLHDVGGNPNSSATLDRGKTACEQNVACGTEFANWQLDIDDHGDSFTDHYKGPTGDHFDIKASWVLKGVFFCLDDEQGRIDGVKFVDLVGPPRGIGQSSCASS